MLTNYPFKFGNPQALWLLWLLPLLGLFFFWVWQRQKTLLAKFADEAVRGRLHKGLLPTRPLLKAALVLLSMAFSVLALAEFKYGFSLEEVKRRGVDIVIALDVSDSMLVEDVDTTGKLSRLERAKREIVDLLELLEGDRLGLVAFAGKAFIECPLTLDYSAFKLFLQEIDTDLISVKGTAIGEALEQSLKVLASSPRDAKAIILITDGEDHEERALTVAATAKEQGVRIFTIGIGKSEGAPIPSNEGGFRKDARGELILSRLDETTLQKMAVLTGGKYVRSTSGNVDLEKIYTQGIKETLTAQELGSKRRQHFKDRFQWLVAISLLLLSIEPLIPLRKYQVEEP